MSIYKHIVDELIEERCEHLRANKALWPLIQPWLYRALGYEKARKMADTIADQSGYAAFENISKSLDLRLNIEGLSQVPKTGRLMVICDHPTGLADGLAVFDALKKHRPDLMFLANADALRVIPGATDVIIPVEWVMHKRTRETARATLHGLKAAMAQERCVIIFPAGKLAKLTINGLQDKPWEASATALARKFGAPITPLHISARNSVLYYLFCILHGELRDITLFHELLNKAGQNFDMVFGPVIDSQSLPLDAAAAIAALRHIVTHELAVTE